MKISFHGAAQEVTGSCTLVEMDNQKFIVDCGIFQGSIDSKNKNLEDFGFDPKTINFVLLTHAHIDHCGRLLKLFSEKFNGKIYCTNATRDLAELILTDSIKINSKEEELPQYTEKDIKNLMELFHTFDYDQKLGTNSNISIRMRDAGHILGSSTFEVWVKENETTKKIVFSGDVGNPPAPIIKDPTFIDEADILFVESTYGGRLHEPKNDGRNTLKNIILETIQNKSTLIIPVFALERSQEILYEFNNFVENKIVPSAPVFFDSPLAIEATAVYRKYQNLYDKEARSLINLGDDIFDFPNLRFTKTRDESKEINTFKTPKIIMAGGGMCNGGRIPHHLKFNLGNPKNNLLIMSYQAEGTLGRELIDGAKSVIINGETIDVHCKITHNGSYSAHGDHNQMINWIKNIKNIKKIFVMHGEKPCSEDLAKAIELDAEKIIPEYHKYYEI